MKIIRKTIIVDAGKKILEDECEIDEEESKRILEETEKEFNTAWDKVQTHFDKLSKKFDEYPPTCTVKRTEYVFQSENFFVTVVNFLKNIIKKFKK